MRSHDYCHFSVTLGANIDAADVPEKCADDMRKAAARLADKAVLQYRIAKDNRNRLENERQSHGWEVDRIERIRRIAETDRTPQQQEELKAFDDAHYVPGRPFDYEDEWDDDDGGSF